MAVASLALVGCESIPKANKDQVTQSFTQACKNAGGQIQPSTYEGAEVLCNVSGRRAHLVVLPKYIHMMREEAHPSLQYFGAREAAYECSTRNGKYEGGLEARAGRLVHSSPDMTEMCFKIEGKQALWSLTSSQPIGKDGKRFGLYSGTLFFAPNHVYSEEDMNWILKSVTKEMKL